MEKASNRIYGEMKDMGNGFSLPLKMCYRLFACHVFPSKGTVKRFFLIWKEIQISLRSGLIIYF